MKTRKANKIDSSSNSMRVCCSDERELSHPLAEEKLIEPRITIMQNTQRQKIRRMRDDLGRGLRLSVLHMIYTLLEERKNVLIFNPVIDLFAVASRLHDSHLSQPAHMMRNS